MKRAILFTIILICVLGAQLSATIPKMRRMVYYDFKVLSYDETNGNVSFTVTVTPDDFTSKLSPHSVAKDCHEIPINISTPDNVIFRANQNMIFNLENNSDLSEQVDLTCPDKKTVMLFFEAECSATGNKQKSRFFIVFDDNEIEISRSGETYKRDKTDEQPVYSEPIRDTINAEQLKIKYWNAFDLRNPDHYSYIKQYVDSLIPQERKGYYKAYITLETTFKILDNNPFGNNLECEMIDVPWGKRNKSQSIIKKN